MATVVQPSGTVTLVLTDREGSTKLPSELEQDGYREALVGPALDVSEAIGSAADEEK